jgi:lactam utilization protein B
MNAQTICIHSDTPNTVAIAEAVREEIKGGEQNKYFR